MVKTLQTFRHIWLSTNIMHPVSLVSHREKNQKLIFSIFFDHLYEYQSFLDKFRFKFIFFSKRIIFYSLFFYFNMSESLGINSCKCDESKLKIFCFRGIEEEILNHFLKRFEKLQVMLLRR